MSRNNIFNEIWNFFQKDDLTKHADCNFCQKSISYKSTVTNLKQHLRIKYIGVYQDFLSRSSQPGKSLNVLGNDGVGGVASSSRVCGTGDSGDRNNPAIGERCS